MPGDPQVVGNGARRSRRFDVARSLALTEYSKLIGVLTPRRPEGRAPRSRQLAGTLLAAAVTFFRCAKSGRIVSNRQMREIHAGRRIGHAAVESHPANARSAAAPTPD